ncbi:MAG: hypothetical protein AB1847_09535 [bacterium]
MQDNDLNQIIVDGFIDNYIEKIKSKTYKKLETLVMPRRQNALSMVQRIGSMPINRGPVWHEPIEKVTIKLCIENILEIIAGIYAGERLQFLEMLGSNEIISYGLQESTVKFDGWYWVTSQVIINIRNPKYDQSRDIASQKKKDNHETKLDNRQSDETKLDMRHSDGTRLGKNWLEGARAVAAGINVNPSGLKEMNTYKKLLYIWLFAEAYRDPAHLPFAVMAINVMCETKKTDLYDKWTQIAEGSDVPMQLLCYRAMCPLKQARGSWIAQAKKQQKLQDIEGWRKEVLACYGASKFSTKGASDLMKELKGEVSKRNLGGKLAQILVQEYKDCLIFNNPQGNDEDKFNNAAKNLIATDLKDIEKKWDEKIKDIMCQILKTDVSVETKCSREPGSIFKKL